MHLYLSRARALPHSVSLHIPIQARKGAFQELSLGKYMFKLARHEPIKVPVIGGDWAAGAGLGAGGKDGIEAGAAEGGGVSSAGNNSQLVSKSVLGVRECAHTGVGGGEGSKGCLLENTKRVRALARARWELRFFFHAS